jgi:hypothetical protein
VATLNQKQLESLNFIIFFTALADNGINWSIKYLSFEMDYSNPELVNEVSINFIDNSGKMCKYYVIDSDGNIIEGEFNV